MSYIRRHITKFRLLSTQVETRCLLYNNKYIKISGKDKSKFLQGLCSNDLNLLQNHGDCIASVFLSSSGRIIVDALIYNVNKGATDSYFIIETHNKYATVLKNYLHSYKLRSAVSIEDANVFGMLIHNKIKTHHVHNNLYDNVEFIVESIDPRTSTLGNRVLMDKSVFTDENNMIPLSTFQNINESVTWYNKFRLINGIIEGPELYNLIPFECNLDLLNYISFKKGCYIGQELMARTQFKGIIRKRFIPFLSIDKNKSIQLGKLNVDLNVGFSEFNTLFNGNIDTIVSNDSNIIEIGDTLNFTIESKELSQIDSSIVETNEVDYVGKVIVYDTNSKIGIALVPLEIIRNSFNNVKCILKHAPATHVQLFKPYFWPELNPNTGKRFEE